jgi:hypothetical protein
VFIRSIFPCRTGWSGSGRTGAEAWQFFMPETLQLEIITVIESLNQLRESPEYELCQLSEQKSGVLDELAAERTKLLETESSELEKQAERLAAEIKELSGQSADRIV